MGTWATASIVFGIDLGENFSFSRPKNITEESWEDILNEYDDESEIFYSILAAEANLPLDAVDDEVQAAIKNCPVDVMTYGSLTTRRHVLYLKQTHVSTDWTEASVVNPAEMETSEKDVAVLRRIAANHGIVKDPAWLLCAQYS